MRTPAGGGAGRRGQALSAPRRCLLGTRNPHCRPLCAGWLLLDRGGTAFCPARWLAGPLGPCCQVGSARSRQQLSLPFPPPHPAPLLTNNGVHPRVLRDHRSQIGRKVEQRAGHGLRQRQPRVELLRGHPAVGRVGAHLRGGGSGRQRGASQAATCAQRVRVPRLRGGHRLPCTHPGMQRCHGAQAMCPRTSWPLLSVMHWRSTTSL